MRFSVVFLALFALAAAVPSIPKFQAGDQEFLKKQQDVIFLYENIAGELPNAHFREIGYNYQFESNLQYFANPNVVKYYVGLYHAGYVQPQFYPYSNSISQLRKEVSLLTQILVGAKNYETFINSAAWARVHVNQDQFSIAFGAAIVQRPDMKGVILPPVYEIYPHYFFDAQILQKVQNFVNKYGFEYHSNVDSHSVHHIYYNYTSYLPYGENQIAYFTEDIGLNTYYTYINLANSMIEDSDHHEGSRNHIGHGSYFYYIHQKLMARYNLERLGQGLGPIKQLDYYWEHIETPYKPNLRYLNGQSFPGRDEHVYITDKHHYYELIKLVRVLEQRIYDAIDAGHVITPHGAFLSLYQPQGLNILGEIIQGFGHSINPRYYGSYVEVAKQLLGQSPYFSNIYEYSPSGLEVAPTIARDPIFYQLYNQVIELFHYYQEGLPAYQYNDLVVPGVSVEKVDVGQLVTFFSDFEVDLANSIAQPVGGNEHEHQPFPKVVAHLKRLDHKPYEYSVYVNSDKVVSGAVVRVFIGPKYNYDGLPIDINLHRHYFYELDQFVYDLSIGQNVIVRNSHQFTGESYDWPSVHSIMSGVEEAVSSSSPFYINYPQQMFGFPARLSLPKGSQSGFPLQFFVIVSTGSQLENVNYGPIVQDEFNYYQPHHYQVVSSEEYEQFVKNPVDQLNGGYQTVDVIPDFDAQIITQGNFHYGYLYKKYPGSYYYPHWQQTYYKNQYSGYQQGVSSSQPSKPYWKVLSQYVKKQHYTTVPPVTPSHYVDKAYSASFGYQKVEDTPLDSQFPVPGSFGAPYVYQKVVETPQGQNYETVYKQGMYESHHDTYNGSGHYPGSYYNSYPAGTFSSFKSHDEYLHNYYENQFIGNIIGGAVSLDNKPLGYPFDRPLAPSALYASNIYVKDVVVYHDNEYFSEY